MRQDAFQEKTNSFRLFLVLTMLMLCQLGGLLLFSAQAQTADAQPDADVEKAIEIFALGDSLTAGFELPQQDAFPAQLETALRAIGVPAKLTNGGVSGDTTTGGLARLDWSLAGTVPKLTIVELGGNDALRGIPAQVTDKNLRQIVENLKTKGSAVLLAGMLAPPNMGAEYESNFNALFAQIAKDLDVPLYPFFLDGVAANPSLLLNDGIHPTSQGVSEIVKRILPHVVSVLVQEGYCGKQNDPTQICADEAFQIAQKHTTQP